MYTLQAPIEDLQVPVVPMRCRISGYLNDSLYLPEQSKAPDFSAILRSIFAPFQLPLQTLINREVCGLY